MDVMGRSEPQSDDEFTAWADELGMPTAIRMQVRYVIGREYDRGRAAADRGAVAVAEAAEVYFREFDHLVGGEDHDYPERLALRDALAAYRRKQ